MAPSERIGDLVLPPNTYAHVLDNTKGIINVGVGPTKVSIGDNDQLVVWLEGQFLPTDSRSEATQPFIRAEEGQYVILHDPAGEDPRRFPKSQSYDAATNLDNGRKVVIPGPISFPLWPGQTAQVLDGHHLRNNQYLLVRVYEPDQAKANASEAVVAHQETTGEGAGTTQATGEGKLAPKAKTTDQTAKKVAESIEYTMGKLMVIKGTDVSFYIPPTGIEVVADPSHVEEPYVRGAVTLQQLEYCILLDENGDKRYVRGPAVVFPNPTEIFQTDQEGHRRFEAIQLNAQSGLYLKVIDSYTEGRKNYTEGEERFITGKDTPIYFPRPEESIISYGEERKHHAIAIPKGEGRYVLDREKGDVDLFIGPKMFLPDPRSQVIIRRVLDPHLCEVMYPFNEEALQANENFANEGWQFANMLTDERLRGVMSPPSGSSHYSSVSSAPASVIAANLATASASSSLLQGQDVEGSYRGGAAKMTAARRSAQRSSVGAQDILRNTTYTPPRTVVLNTKYEGAVKQSVYPGYAIMLVNSTGQRRVIKGPHTVLLAYDESPMILSLSTGKPKNTDNRLETCYLRTTNNQVSDRVVVETQDLVPVTIDISYRVNFEGDPEKWFDMENYVKVLTDHCRSKLRNLAKRHKFQKFYDGTIDLIRDHLLGTIEDASGKEKEPKGRKGLIFEENGMHLFEIEVLGVNVNNNDIQTLTRQASFKTIEGAIKLAQEETETTQNARMEELKRTSLEQVEKTKVKQAELALASLERSLNHRVREVEAELKTLNERKAVSDLQRSELTAMADMELEIERKQKELELTVLKEQVVQYVERSKAVSKDLVTALSVFGDQRFTEEITKALGPVAVTMGVTTADLLENTFKGTAAEGILSSLTHRPYALATNGGSE